MRDIGVFVWGVGVKVQDFRICYIPVAGCFGVWVWEF